jgi:hypothetical protein
MKKKYKQSWTHDEFDALTWHDNYIHGMRVVNPRGGKRTMQSSVPLTRGTPAAYAPAAPRVAVRSLLTFDGISHGRSAQISNRGE